MESTGKFGVFGHLVGSVIIEQHPRELRWLAPTKLQQKWVIIDHTVGHRREEWRDVPVVAQDSED